MCVLPQQQLRYSGFMRMPWALTTRLFFLWTAGPSSVLPSWGEDPEKLQKDFENKLLEAKTVRIKFKIRKSKPFPVKTSGILLGIKDANKIRYEVTDLEGNRFTRILIADGRQMKSKGFEGTGTPDGYTDKSRPTLDRELVTGIARLGLYSCLDWPGYVRLDREDVRKLPPIGFKPPESVNLGDQPTFRFEFRAGPKQGHREPPSTTWWYETAHRQASQMYRLIPGEAEADVTEFYESIELDQPIADKEFEIRG